MLNRLLLVGCGNMGYALLKRWTSFADGFEIFVVEPDEALRLRASIAGAVTFGGSEEIPGSQTFDVIVLAVKPHHVLPVVSTYRECLRGKGTFISLAAGVTVGSTRAVAPADCAIVRVMPNMPASIGEGMMVGFAEATISSCQQQVVIDLMSCAGRLAFVDREELMHAVTAISGSGPAYVFHFIEALESAAKEAGLPDDLSRLLAMQTLYGASRLAIEADRSPADLRREVTSPGGTTAAALDQLMKKPEGLERLIGASVKAALDRSFSLVSN